MMFILILMENVNTSEIIENATLHRAFLNNGFIASKAPSYVFLRYHCYLLIFANSLEFFHLEDILIM